MYCQYENPLKTKPSPQVDIQINIDDGKEININLIVSNKVTSGLVQCSG